MPAKKKPTKPTQPDDLQAPANTNEAAEWVDDRTLAERTPISRVGWQTWRARGEGPPYHKVGRRCLYKWAEVEAWLESKRVEPKAS
jgi:hypothetical protein